MIIDLIIFDNRFTLECEPEFEQQLRQTAKQLDQALRDAKKSSPKSSSERIAVLMCLNYLQQQQIAEQKLSDMDPYVSVQLIGSMMEQINKGLEQIDRLESQTT